MIDQSPVTADQLADDPRITGALEAYIAAFETGDPVDRQQFLEQHAEIQAELAAAAEAMRRILVESARRKSSLKAGHDFERVDLEVLGLDADDRQVDLIALDEALTRLEQQQPEKAEIVKLRFFAGLSLEETAAALGISRASTQRKWAYARAWLFGQLHES